MHYSFIRTGINGMTFEAEDAAKPFNHFRRVAVTVATTYDGTSDSLAFRHVFQTNMNVAPTILLPIHQDQKKGGVKILAKPREVASH
jgi:hypothetical protein